MGFHCIDFGFLGLMGKYIKCLVSIVPVSDMLGALHGGNGDDFVVLEGLLYQV